MAIRPDDDPGFPTAPPWRKVPFLSCSPPCCCSNFPRLLADKSNPSADRIVKMSTGQASLEKAESAENHQTATSENS